MFDVRFLQNERFIVFSSREYAVHCGVTIDVASKRLKQLGASNSIQSITRGIWANCAHPAFSPYAAIPLLLGSEQGYVSFLSALHRAGVLSQIPKTIQIATTGRARTLKSSIGTFEFFHLKPEMFREGIDWAPAKSPYLMATPEKALLDTFYIATRKTTRFSKLPELDLEGINRRVFLKLLATQVEDKKIRKSVSNRWSNSIL